MDEFKQDKERDALLVYAGMVGGFQGVCGCALEMSISAHPEMKGGPDRVIQHADWLRAQPKDYMSSVCIRAAEIERERAG